MFAPTSVLVSVQPEVPAIELGKSAAARLWQTSPANGSFTVGAPRLRIGALGLALALPAPPAVPPPPPHAATNAAETTMSVAPLNRIRLLHHRAGARAPGRRTVSSCPRGWLTAPTAGRRVRRACAPLLDDRRRLRVPH